MESQLPAAPKSSKPQSDDERAHLTHCSAEINSAIREGMYCHMLPPEVNIVSAMEDEDGVLHVAVKYKLKYYFEPIDPKRVVEVDLRDEVTKKRSPDYQPPGAV